ncbi:MAG TPA: response regulator transcription factor [Chitinophagaceae bacterium]|nr:response regulator transcription factor [Chitinophagaceae bacterium]
MRPVIIGFGLLILCLLIVFKIGEVNFTKGNVRLEVIVAIVAMIFFFVGLYFNYQSQKKAGVDYNETTSDSYRDSSQNIDYEQIKKVGLTQREHDVLVKMAEGLSNQEIAQQLFLSESTVKTHVSNILFKLEAKRRTQAVQSAKKLKIVT